MQNTETMEAREEFKLDQLETHPGKTPLVDLKVKEFITGDISQDTFLEYLDTQRNFIVDLLEESDPEGFSTELELMTKDYIESLRQGLSVQLTAFDSLEDWVHSGDGECKQQAFALLQQGDVFLTSALRTSFESTALLVDQARELLSALGHSPGSV